MSKCPYCKKEFVANEIDVEEIDMAGDRLNKAVYSCPHCKTFLALGDIAEAVEESE